jgi:hypothetical protein
MIYLCHWFIIFALKYPDEAKVIDVITVCTIALALILWGAVNVGKNHN